MFTYKAIENLGTFGLPFVAAEEPEEHEPGTPTKKHSSLLWPHHHNEAQHRTVPFPSPRGSELQISPIVNINVMAKITPLQRLPGYFQTYVGLTVD